METSKFVDGIYFDFIICGSDVNSDEIDCMNKYYSSDDEFFYRFYDSEI